MNTDERKKFLAESFREALHQAEQERIDKERVARLTKDMQARLAPLLAETSRQVKCPHCGQSFDTSWRTDEVTGDTNNDDDVNEQDGEGPASAPAYDNRRPVRPLSSLTRAQIMASLGKIRC